jgi:hypothetical protein
MKEDGTFAFGAETLCFFCAFAAESLQNHCRIALLLLLNRCGIVTSSLHLPTPHLSHLPTAQLVCPISYEESSGVWEKLQNDVSERLTLRSVTWKDPVSSSFVVIDKLPLRLLPRRPVDTNNAFRWYLAPCLSQRNPHPLFCYFNLLSVGPRVVEIYPLLQRGLVRFVVH